MFIERFFVEGLAHASYLVGKDGEAAVVDPKRDVEDYLAAAARHEARITAVFETHPHADFVSGHVDLARATGAPIYVSRLYPAEFPHRKLAHGEEVAIGGLRIQALETPGHSPDSLSLYVDDDGHRAVFTGDILFVGDVGRPDLRDMHADPTEMASALYDSLHQVLYRLPDDTVVYPAHGAGSLCGRRLGSAPTTTIGAEKLSNWANQFPDRASFVEAMVSNLPDRPRFFFHCPFVNIRGPRPLAEVPRPEAIDPPASARLMRETTVLDVRRPEAFASGHLRGSLNVGAHVPVFSTWVGTFLDPDTRLLLVVESHEQAHQAWLDLARIGYEAVAAYLVADLPAWRAADVPVVESGQMGACDLGAWVEKGRPVLDVRTAPEWERDHLEGAIWIPLSRLPERIAEVPAGPLAVVCGSGFRSSLAISLLERAGRDGLVNVNGGWAAWANCGCVEPDALDLRG